MNFIFVSVSCKNVVQLIEIKYFDKLSYQDIQYTVSRECNLRDPVFCTANGLPIKDNFLADYVENFAQDSSFVLFVKEGQGSVLQSAIAQTAPAAPQTSVSLISHEEEIPQNNFNSKEDLLKFLQGNPTCCIILATYQKTNQLSGSDRTKISKSIVQHYLLNHPNRSLSRDDFNKIITYICELFPEEKRETYLKKTRNKYIGKLHDAFNNYRNTLANKGIIKRRARNTNGEKNLDNFNNDEIAINSSSLIVANEPIIINQSSNVENQMDPLQQHCKDDDQESIHTYSGSLENFKLLFENNPLLKDLKAEYKKETELTHRDKIRLCNEILNNLTLDCTRNLSEDDFENISKFIAKIFPAEKPEIYHYRIDPNSKNISGLLSDAYNHMLEVSGNEKYSNISTKTNIADDSLQIKIEPSVLATNTSNQYLNLDDIHNQLNEENVSQNSELFVSPKRRLEIDCDSLRNEEKSNKKSKNDNYQFNKNILETDKSTTEIFKNFTEEFSKVQRNLMTDFFDKQSKQMQEEREYQNKQNLKFLNSLEDQTSKILSTLKRIFDSKSSQLSSASTVTATSTTN